MGDKKFLLAVFNLPGDLFHGFSLISLRKETEKGKAEGGIRESAERGRASNQKDSL